MKSGRVMGHAESRVSKNDSQRAGIGVETSETRTRKTFHDR